jgi:uncharacterized membrane protein
VLVWRLTDVQEDLPLESPSERIAAHNGKKYRQLDDGEFIPLGVYEVVRKQPGTPLPATADDYFRRYIDLTYLRPHVAIPVFLAVFVLLLYLLGKFMAVGIGVMFAGTFERAISRVPGVRAVYSSVKQVSDFIFTQRDFRFTRVVAVEFPRKGVWSLGFVTSDSFTSIGKHIDSPVLNVFVPYAPVPITGCIITIAENDCLDLDVTFDQAIQFIMSCGVVVPPKQLEQADSGQWPVASGQKEEKEEGRGETAKPQAASSPKSKTPKSPNP